MPAIRWAAEALDLPRIINESIARELDAKEMPDPTQPPAPVQPAQQGQEPPTSLPSYSGLRALRSWARDLFLCFAVMFLIIFFFYQPVRVEGSSMEPGLEDQERIVINKLVYRVESIDRGDIVVFRYPRDPRKSFIKRVIGLPGDHLRISYGRVFVNGKKVEEPYVPAEFLDSRSSSEIEVPADAYYVLGDHRSMSNDSRDFGLVGRGNIYGKAVFGYWPVEKLGVLR
jgi:signal peptidase I